MPPEINNIGINAYWLLPLTILELVLKGLSLWRAAQEKQLYWFVAILILNTFGILPAIYLFLYYRKHNKI